MILNRDTFPATSWLWRHLTSHRVVRFYVSCVALVLILSAFNYVQILILRYRAEHLLSDIRQLELRRSTWADSQKLIDRWGAWGNYEGSCTQASCDYQIQLVDFQERLVERHPTLGRTLYVLGGGFLIARPASIRAGLTVADGTVWGKSFGAYLYARGTSELFNNGSYTLIGKAESVQGLNQLDNPDQYRLHKEYLIGRPGGCETCIAGYAKFTPFAAPTDVEKLMDFNLSCITRWRSCHDQADIMPGQWKQYLAEEDIDNPASSRDQ